MLKKTGNFIKKEAVLFISAICAITTMLFITPDSEYLAYIDLRVLCLLLCLMAVVAGLKAIGVFKYLTYQLLSRIQNGHILSVTLVLLPFFSSMLITNDVALIIFVSFTLILLEQIGWRSSIIPILVLQTVAANLGSMATPVGNPQNLYLYSTYNISPLNFFSTTLPLTLVSLVCIIASSIPMLPKQLPKPQLKQENIQSQPKLIAYTLMFVLCLLTVFQVIHYSIVTAIIVVAIIFVDKKIFLKLDYALLLTFVCFFIISGNLGRIAEIRTFLQSLLEANPMATTIYTSQIISNVPAAVLLSGFTDKWQQLLQGVNIGSLGTPIASLASLITLKLYLGHPDSKALKFLGVFTLANIIAIVVLLSAVMLLNLL